MAIVSICGLALIGYGMYLVSEHVKRKQNKEKLDESFNRIDRE
jgi:hypothetical protein